MRWHRLCGIVCFLSFLSGWPGHPPQVSGQDRARALLEGLPARFVPNQGQWTSPELYRAQVGGMQVFLETKGWSFCVRERGGQKTPAARVPAGARSWSDKPRRGVAVRMSFLGGRGTPVCKPGPRLSGTSNYFLGRDARRHRSSVPAYASVTYAGVYAGIDVRLRETKGHLEYDLLVAPGAELSRVQVRVEGVQSLRIDDRGSLVMETELGPVHQPAPQTWEETADGAKRPLRCRYVLLGDDRFGFTAPDRDAELPLVVDPLILYSTYIGGSGNEEAYVVREDANGKVLLAGRTRAADFPTTAGAFQPKFQGGTWDGFVLRLDPTRPPNQQLDYSTYLGGSGDDDIYGAVLRPGGLVSVVGLTASPNFPVQAGAFQTRFGGGASDAFCAVLDASGSKVLYASYLGGAGDDAAWWLSLGPGSDHVITGWTTSPKFPTTGNAFQGTNNGGGPSFGDGFVTRMNVTCTSLGYSSFLGGSGADWAANSHVDAKGVITFVGGTSSPNLPVKGAYDPTYGGGFKAGFGDVYVARLDSSLPVAQQLQYLTYLGGTSDEFCYAINVDAKGVITIAGTTASTTFPTTPGVYGPKFSGGANAGNFTAGDAFLSRLDPSQSGSKQLVFSTFLGGAGQDQGLQFDLDSDGVITLVGWTQFSANNFPTTPGAWRRVYQGNEGFVCRLSPDARQLLYSTLIGGYYADGAWLVTRHKDGVATASIQTQGASFPLKNAVQPVHGGGTDASITRLDLVPQGTRRFGGPSRSANGWPTIHALGDAVPGNQSFGLACSRAPANKPGVLLVTTSRFPTGVRVLGIDLWVTPQAPALLLSLAANGAGEHVLPLPYPNVTLPPLYAQYVWFESVAPVNLSASDALQF